MTSQAPAGWYPDPSGAPGQRWWDGGAWTASVTPAIPQPVTSPPTYDGNLAAAPMPVTGAPASPSPYVYPPTAMGQAYPAKSHGANHYALITFGVVALYIVVAATTRVVFFGILPLGLAFRSKRGGEPLAPLAIGAAVLSVIVAIALLTGH